MIFRNVFTFPFRAGVRASRLGFRVTEQVLTMPLRVTRSLITPPATEEPHRGAATIDIVVASWPSAPEPTSAPSSAPLERAAEAPPGEAAAALPTPLPTPEAHVSEEPAPAPSPTPAHVSEEPRLVEAFAGPGAEDGAGAAVHVREPWKGYAQMTASQVIGRLPEATREELAAVTLYETSHRGRRTVLASARHELRRAAASELRTEPIATDGALHAIPGR